MAGGLITARGVRSDAPRERGTFAVLFAILAVVFFLMAAVAIDLSDARSKVRANQTTVDLAGLAAGAYLTSDPYEACIGAWLYLRANLPDLPAGATSPCDSGQPLAFPSVCGATASTDYEALNEEPHEIVFTYPVSADHETMLGRASPNDGDPCERFGISVRTEREVFFGGIAGSDGLMSPASSVVRAHLGTNAFAPVALLLLDPIGCESGEPIDGTPEPGPLLAVGNGGVKVFASTPTFPGFIAVDSNGTESDCGGQNFTMDAQGGPPRIFACGNVFDPADADRCDPGGKIELFAMNPDQVVCNEGVLVACDHKDVTDGRVVPQPLPLAERLTRAPVDHRYNCQTGYPNYRPDPEVPADEVPIPDCAGPTTGLSRDGDAYSSDYIDELRVAVGATGPPPEGSWNVYGDDPGEPCDTTASGPPLVLGAGNWFVDCTEFIIKKDVTFAGGNIVFQGRLNLTSQGSLSINESNPNATLGSTCEDMLCPNVSSETHAWVYLRNDAFVRSGGAPLRMRGATLVTGDDAGGRIHLTGGSGDFVWTAPTEGPFEDLLLWSESSCSVCAVQPFDQTAAYGHFMAGQAGQIVEGVFFTPMAVFEYAGEGSQDQAEAQFLTYRMLARGKGALRMAPDPDRAVLFPVASFLLIR